jgi:hypothetical protein
MMLYTEKQLANAYRVYLLHVPAGQRAMEYEDFRKEVEEDEETFELLLDEFERLPEIEKNTH